MTAKSLLAFLIGMIFFAAPSSAQSPEKVFRMRLLSDPQTMDWTLATTQADSRVLMNIMEGLMEFDAKMQLKPGLAKSYFISPDNLTYTFRLREDVRWSDGKSLTAQDFVDSWRRLLDPLTGASYAYLLYDVEGAEDFNKRALDDFSKVGMKAIDALTVQVKLKHTVPYFLQMFTFWVTFPIRQDLVKKYGADWVKPGKIAVVGPFIPSLYEPQNKIVLKRNPNYYRKTGELDSVEMLILNEDTTALNLFKSGKIDMLMPINHIEASNFVKTPEYHSVPYFSTHYLGFNTTKYPLNLPKVRQAIAMAIDKTKIHQALHQDKPAAPSLIPPELYPEGAGVGLKYDPERARMLFEETGINPKEVHPIEFLSYSSDENALLAQYVQEELRKNLGLAIEVKLPEFKTFRTLLDLKTTGIFYVQWGADYADPDTYFDVFRSDSGNNKTGWKNAKYDAAIDTGGRLMNRAARVKEYKTALEELLVNDVAIVPLHYNRLTYLLNTKVKNFIINPLNYVYFRDIVVTR